MTARPFIGFNSFNVKNNSGVNGNYLNNLHEILEVDVLGARQFCQNFYERFSYQVVKKYPLMKYHQYPYVVKEK